MIYEAFWAAISSMMSRKQQRGQAVEVGVLRHLDGAFLRVTIDMQYLSPGCSASWWIQIRAGLCMGRKRES